VAPRRAIPSTHAWDDADLTTLSAPDQQHEICDDRTNIQSHGLPLPTDFAYTYGAQRYQVVVNGYTGAIAGVHPLSWVKITLLIIAILIVVVLIGMNSD